MNVIDLDECVPDARADRFACSFGLITESSAAATQSGGGGQRVNQFGAFGAELFGSFGVPAFLGVLDLDGETVQARLEPCLCGVVQDRVGAGRGDPVADQGQHVDVGT